MGAADSSLTVTRPHRAHLLLRTVRTGRSRGAPFEEAAATQSNGVSGSEEQVAACTLLQVHGSALCQLLNGHRPILCSKEGCPSTRDQSLVDQSSLRELSASLPMHCVERLRISKVCKGVPNSKHTTARIGYQLLGPRFDSTRLG